MTPLIHNYSHLTGKIIYWDTTDSQECYIENCKDQSARQKLIDSGYLDRPIEYRFNSHGFRTAEFDQGFDVVCFGDSFTMGTGVHGQDTWPEQLGKITGLRTANLGHAGSSNDTAFRYAAHYLKDLKPKYAVWLQTDRHRFELLDDDRKVNLNVMASDKHNPCADDYYVKVWFSSPSNHDLNLQKNTWAFEHLCSSLGIRSIILSRYHTVSEQCWHSDNARDLTHPGPESYKKLAQQVKSMLQQY